MTLMPRRDGDALQELLALTGLLGRARRRGQGSFGYARDEFMRRASTAGAPQGHGPNAPIDAAGLPVDPRRGEIAVDDHGLRQRYLGPNAAGARVWAGADLPAVGPDDPATSDELVVTAPRRGLWRDLRRGDLGRAARDVAHGAQTAWRDLQSSRPALNGGGLYGDFGLGVGPGFNLHFDRYGVSPSVGGGLFGRLQMGYAPTAEALSEAAQENRIFAQAKVGRSGIGGHYKYDGDGPREVGIEAGPLNLDLDVRDATIAPGASIEAGKTRKPPEVKVDPRGVSFGFDSGIGWLHSLKGRKWSPPGGKAHRP